MKHDGHLSSVPEKRSARVRSRGCAARAARLPCLLGAALSSACVGAAPDGTVDPKSVATYDVARDAFEKGRLRDALSKVDEALETDPDNADAAYLGAIVHLAFCAKDASSTDCRFGDAERYAKQALAAQPEMRDAKNTLGVILVHLERYDDAIAVLKPLTGDILYASPEKSWGNLGWAYLEKGEIDLAIDALLRSVGAQPTFCVGNFRLGLAYEKKGDAAAAHAAFTRALETDRPGCKELQEAWEARGRAATKLGNLDGARGDYGACRELSASSASGRRCDASLRSLPASSPAPSSPAPEPSSPAPEPAPPSSAPKP